MEYYGGFGFYLHLSSSNTLSNVCIAAIPADTLGSVSIILLKNCLTSEKIKKGIECRRYIYLGTEDLVDRYLPNLHKPCFYGIERNQNNYLIASLLINLYQSILDLDDFVLLMNNE